MWGYISLWFWFASPLWLVMLDIFSRTCWPSACRLYKMAIQILCPFFNWVVFLLLFFSFLFCFWCWGRNFLNRSPVASKLEVVQDNCEFYCILLGSISPLILFHIQIFLFITFWLRYSDSGWRVYMQIFGHRNQSTKSHSCLRSSPCNKSLTLYYSSWFCFSLYPDWYT